METHELYNEIISFNEYITRERETLSDRCYYMQEKEALEKATFLSFIIKNYSNFSDKLNKIVNIIDLSFGSGNLSTKIIVENKIPFNKLVLNDKFNDDSNVKLEYSLQKVYVDRDISTTNLDFFEHQKFADSKYDLVIFNPTSGGKTVSKDYNKNGDKSNLILTLNKVLSDDSIVVFNGKKDEFDFLFKEYNSTFHYISQEGSDIFFSYKSKIDERLTFHNLDGIKKYESDSFIDMSTYDLDGLENNISLKIQQIKPPRDESSIISISEDPTITNAKLEEVLSFIESLPKEKKTDILELFGSQHLTNEDINILLGRKKSLETFELHLKDLDWDEKEWQAFFEDNSWIFGYGLNYQYLKILQREGHISSVDLDGKNEVIIDFLMANANFTILVELKKPDTPLFGSRIERSEAWKLSTDLHSALSQILAQKAEWQIKSETKNYDSESKLIKQFTVDPKTILIIGSSIQYSNEETRENEIKSRTFELFRRNSRNIDIITFDELYARAYYIVYQQQL